MLGGYDDSSSKGLLQ
uniref:Uncharacterized protein n=1 Tax=Schistosoma mansoni TaxID=6183 RepID=A0A146MGG2_SCHMA